MTLLRTHTLLFTLFALASLTSGCGLLFGNIRPVVEKADDYSVVDLSKKSKDWIRLRASQERSGSKDNAGVQASTDVSDRAFQSKTTDAIISLTSTCRPNTENLPFSLEDYSRQLLMGFTEVTEDRHEKLTLSGLKAHQATVAGQMNGRPLKVTAVVVRKDRCIFDLMFIAQKKDYDTHLPDFNQFVQSFKIKP